jgi:hypothetical protein
MAEAAPEQDQQSLRMKLRDVEDFAKKFLRNRIESLREDHDELEARVDELEAEIEQLRAWRENVTGVADDRDSDPQKRVIDLREAMIRTARQSDRDGVTWWWKQVRDNLTTLGHEGFSKTTYHDTMTAAADADGFSLTEKTVAIDRGNRTANEDVKAVRVNLAKLPANDAQAVRNQVSNDGGVGDAGESHANHDETDESTSNRS